jgi:hypothetical protein
MTGYDSTADTLKHSRRVGELMIGSHRAPRHSRQAQLRAALALAAALALVAGAVSLSMGGARPAPAATDGPLSVRDECAQALTYPSRSATDRDWLRKCVHALATPPAGTPTTTPSSTPSPTPTASPTGSPTPSPTTPAPSPTSPSPTQSPTPTPTVTAGCPAWPAIPTPACTGYAHTGVILRDCPARITVPGTYDGCRFTGDVIVSVTGVIVTRSLVLGTVNSSGGTLYGSTWTDVEIDSSTADPGLAAIGSDDWTCTRCHMHGGTRGANLGDNSTLVDSYVGDMHPVANPADPSGWYHSTAAGTHGSQHVRVEHSWLRCDGNDPANPQCSSAFAVYGDGAANNDLVVHHNRFDSGSSYCVGLFPKGYAFTAVIFTDNLFGDLFERFWPGQVCSQYGPLSGWPGGSTNTFSGNVDARGNPVVP